MISRFNYLFPAIELLNAHDMGQDVDSRRAWINQVDMARIQLPLLAKVLPILELCAQWVQVLSSGNSVTISLVRLACKSLKDCLDNMLTETRTLADGSLMQQALGIKLSAVIRSLVSQYNIYFGEDYRQYYAFTIGEALDPRLFGTLTSADKASVLNEMRNLSTHFEYTSPNGRYMATTSAAARRSSRNQQPTVATTGDEFEDRVALEAIENLSETLDKRIPLIEEWDSYKKLVSTLSPLERDPMTFWTKYNKEMPILCRMVRRIFPARACSTDVERLFSLTGRICSPLRNRLLPSMVNILACMNIWLREKFEYFNRTAQRYSQANVSKFVAINVNLELINPNCEWDVEDSDESDDEN